MNLDPIYIEPPTKHCLKCECDLPLSEFGVDRTRADGLNVYCKADIREIARSANRRTYQNTRNALLRANARSARPSAKNAVMKAIEAGARTQWDIKQAAKWLTEQELTDAIAELYDEGKLNRIAIRQRRYELAA